MGQEETKSHQVACQGQLLGVTGSATHHIPRLTEARALPRASPELLDVVPREPVSGEM